MGKQSRLRKVRKIVKREGGINGRCLSNLKFAEAITMNANTGKLSLGPKR